MHKPKPWQRFTALAIITGLVAADQLVKLWAQANLRFEAARALVPGVLGLQYAENTGISFSMLGDSQAAMRVVTILTGLLMLAGLVLLLWGKFGGMQLWSAALILAGGLGNLIDRLRQGFVVDYFEFLFVRFAIFNLADVFITCGVIWLAVIVLWGERWRSKAAVLP